MLELLWLVPILPLTGAFVLGVFGRRFSQTGVSVIGVGSAGLSFGVALGVAAAFLDLPAESIPVIQRYFTWLEAGTFRVEASFFLDQLSLLMILVVTGVGFLIHVYSVGYMAHEGGYYRFFAYLNLFMFFMLTLVLAGNYALLFVGWEGVGLCSYLLIGFYFLRDSASNAGKKAFIVNRIGDFGFTVGLLVMFWTFGSLDYSAVFARAGSMPVEAADPTQAGVLTLITLLLLVGATGKSAQLPLYVWLPDAMEGPTPVSALIHAATMVAAGVYMVARSHILFSLSPLSLSVVAVVGCVTAFYAATIGLVQTDIKRILAYSTISQLGYMFLACGVGAYAAGMFHLMTHAFFKALLFLAAGSVIHAMSGQQDIQKMGGLRKKIPVTYWTMLAGTLAIAGVPGFSGFFSKDAILWQTYSSPLGSKVLWALALGGALLTAFYMFRLVFLTFHGSPRFDEHKTHVHESPRAMLVPLILLALLSVGGGWSALPMLWGGANHLEEFLAPVFAPSTMVRTQLAVEPLEHAHALELTLMLVATVAATLGFLVAFWFYLRRPQTPVRLAESFHAPYKLLLNKYYMDEIYGALFVRPLQWLSERVFWQVVDIGVVDGTANGTAARAMDCGQWVRRLQSGNTRSYGAWVALGALAALSYFVFR